MGNVKVKCLNPRRFGQKVSLPVVGETMIPADGILELDEQVAKIILDGGNKNYELLEDLSQKDSEDSKGSDETKKVSKKSKKDAKKVKEEVIEDEDDADEDEDQNDSDSDEDSDEDNSEEDQDSDDEEETDEDSLKDLDKLGLDELIDMAKELGHKQKDFSKFAKSKKLMINFLKKN